MRAFAERRLEAEEFESVYLALFKNDPTMWPQEVFDVLNRLFTDVDAYSPDPALRGRNDIDEAELRKQTELAINQLNDAVDAM